MSTGEQSPKRVLRPLLVGLFAVTGFAALTLQVVWQRVISLHNGVDLFSTTTVVAAFLGGLGVGSLLGGIIADRLGARRALLAFAGSNAVIALFAFVSLRLFYDLYAEAVDTIGGGLFASFAFNVVLLAVPTTLMGLSLPLISRGLVGAVDEIGPMVGRLYAVNTLGAAAGAATTGWYLLGTHGFEASVRVAATLNLLAAVSIFLLWRAAGSEAPVTEVEAETGSDPVATAAPAGDVRGVVPWFLLYGLTGAVALGLEIVFFRVIDTVMRSNSYSFAHVLSLYLLVLGAGSAVGSRLVRRTTRPEQGFLWCQLGVGVTALLGVILLVAPLRLDWPGFLADPMFRYFDSNGFVNGGWSFDGWGATGKTLFANLGAPLLVMGAPVFLAGMAYPFVQAVVARQVDTLGRRTGTLTFANIVGNVTGSLLVGFVLVHQLGTSWTFRVLALVLLVPGFLAVKGAPAGSQKVLGPVVLATMLLLVAVFPSNDALYGHFLSAGDKPFVVDEERSCVTSIRRDGEEWGLFINGSGQNKYPWDHFHVVVGMLPALVHPDPQRALAVGLGMGGTSYGMAIDPRMDHVRTVEICGGEIDLLRTLAERDGGVMEELFTDPRITLDEGDGRKALLQAEERYDVVTVDTLRPTAAYSGSLYSREFYELVRSRLTDDGIMAQWIPEPLVLDTVQHAFPYVLVIPDGAYKGANFLLASSSPIPYDAAVVQQRLKATKYRSVFPPILVQGVEAFLGLTEPYVPAPSKVGDDEVNRDLFPRNEYFLNN